MGGDEFSYSTSYSRTCNELQNIAPEDRTEKQVCWLQKTGKLQVEA